MDATIETSEFIFLLWFLCSLGPGCLKFVALISNERISWLCLINSEPGVGFRSLWTCRFQWITSFSEIKGHSPEKRDSSYDNLIQTKTYLQSCWCEVKKTVKYRSRMGLLTDPNSSENGLFGRISTYATPLSWFLYSLGVVFIFVMPHPEFSHKTYFSENALLPGLVKGDYHDDGLVERYIKVLL